ncbi:MAG: RNA polymerase sigma factor [Planctomycetota bacterium]|jgi:RNA polymerase sigma-70 factor (ECF subfamily)
MPESLDDKIRSAATGDPEAWRWMIEAYSPRVYGLLYRQCGNADLAEEITQATFAKIVTRLADYQEQGRFDAWLFRIAVNQLRDELRRQKRQAKAFDFEATPPEAMGHSDAGPMPHEAMDTRERHAGLHEAMSRLPEADRELLHLRYTAELSFAQIAETLDQPLGTVLARGHRALKKLRQTLKAEAQA